MTIKKKGMDLDSYQRDAARTDVRPDLADPAFPLLGLAGEVGSLVSQYKKRQRAGELYEGFDEEVLEEVGDLLWYAAALARTVGISLSDAAQRNLKKSAEIFGTKLPPASRYDAAFPTRERLPRKFRMLFVPRKEGGVSRVRMFFGDRPFGDPLDDNAYEEDYYRFHDVLHLAHAAVLGWSPLLRRMLKRKRKSDPSVDRVEDGARAVFLEEGLVAYVFTEAAQVGFYKDATRVGWELIKSVRRMTRHLEVGDQPPIAWQAAFLQGFAAFRELRRHNGGVVEADLNKRVLSFVEPRTAIRPKRPSRKV